MRVSWIALLVSSTLLAGACSSRAPASGFLGDRAAYASLEPSDFDSDVLIWRAPSFDPGSYGSFVIDEVQVVLNEEGKEAGLDPKDTAELAALFRTKIETALGGDYTIVERTGPGVLQIRAALTDVESNTIALNILPQTVLLGFGIGGASMEMEGLDGGSEKRVLAAMASAEGKRYKYLNGLSEWGHAEEVLEYWADMIKMRVDEAHGKGKE